MFKQLHFKSLLLMLCMTLGAGHAWADDTTATVDLSSGEYSTDHITWTIGSAVTITQLKGSSTTNVNSSYISAPRVYKGHILSFTASTNVVIKSISITVNGTYYGNSMTAGTELDGSTVTDNTTDVNRVWTTTSGGTHVVSSVSSDGLSQIYIQNVSPESNVQLRITSISVTYESTGVLPSTAEVSFADESKTIGIGTTYTNTISTTPSTLVVSYVSGDTNIATVDASTGEVTGVGAGTTTITANWEAQTIDETNYAEGSKYYTIRVAGAIEDGIFNFGINQDYGSGLTPSNGNEYITETKTWTAGNITLVTSGKYRWWSTDGTLRLFDSGDTENPTAITLSAPEGKVITALAFTGSNLTGITADKGTYNEGSWTGSAQTVVFTRSSANAQIKTITVSYDDAPSVVAPEFSLAGGYYNGTQSVTLSTETEGATIYYTTDGTEPTAESTEYTGAISVSATTTIKAVAVKDETLSVVESATYVIVAHDGTLESPFTVAEANEILNAGFKPTNVYVSGIISQIDEVSTANGNATYWISDDGTTTDQLEIYRGKSYDGEAFTSEDEIAVGDAVTVYGSLTIYGTTNEFKQGSSIVRPTTPDAPVLGIEGVSAELIANVYFKTAQSISVTATDGATVYYTTDGTDPTTESSVYDATAGITLDKSATVKAIAVLGTVTSEIASLNVSIYTKGDVSEDGKVSLGDVTELINILLSE